MPVNLNTRKAFAGALGTTTDALFGLPTLGVAQ